MNRKRLSGKIMFGIGFLMILVNALNYLLGWKMESPVLGIMGLVFIGVGLKANRK